MTDYCYLGHEDCYDRHEAERLADEADYESEIHPIPRYNEEE